MEGMKLHNKTHWLYTHFFHFFDIPHFLPYELVKKFLKHWNKFFNSRDVLADNIENKENALNDFNIDKILDVIESISKELNTTKSAIDDIISKNKSDMTDLTNNGNDFEGMLNEIISYQNDYGWKT